MQGLIGPLKELAEFEELCKNKKKDAGMIRVCGCVNSQKSHMMYAIGSLRVNQMLRSTLQNLKKN